MGFASEIKSQILKSAAQGSRILAAGRDRNPKSIKHILICMNRRKRHILIYLYGWEKELDDREIPWVVFVRRGGWQKAEGGMQLPE